MSHRFWGEQIILANYAVLAWGYWPLKRFETFTAQWSFTGLLQIQNHLLFAVIELKAVTANFESLWQLSKGCTSMAYVTNKPIFSLAALRMMTIKTEALLPAHVKVLNWLVWKRSENVPFRPTQSIFSCCCTVFSTGGRSLASLHRLKPLPFLKVTGEDGRTFGWFIYF